MRVKLTKSRRSVHASNHNGTERTVKMASNNSLLRTAPSVIRHLHRQVLVTTVAYFLWVCRVDPEANSM